MLISEWMEDGNAWDYVRSNQPSPDQLLSVVRLITFFTKKFIWLW